MKVVGNGEVYFFGGTYLDNIHFGINQSVFIINDELISEQRSGWTH